MSTEESIHRLGGANRTKSENGASTNLSEGSNDTGDDDLKPQPGEKFEFINEGSENWPQWTVGKQNSAQQTEQQQTQTIEKPIEEAPVKINYLPYEDDDIYYCRGMTSQMRKRMRERQEELRKRREQGQTSKSTSQNNPQPEKKGFLQKIKGWFA